MDIKRSKEMGANDGFDADAFDELAIAIRVQIDSKRRKTFFAYTSLAF